MRAGVFRPGGPVAAIGRPRKLRGSRAGATQRRRPVGIVAAQALRAAPDGVLAGEMPPHQDTQPRAAAPARLLGELQGQALEAPTLSRPTSRSASSASRWSRSTASPTGTKALAGSAGGRVNSRL